MVIILVAVLLVHLGFYRFIFSNLLSYKPDHCEVSDDFSIVVCFKNEADKVDAILSKLLLQGCKDIILVDDFSTDTTLQLLRAYESDTIHIIQATEDLPGKKQAAIDGAKAAKYDRIIYTDADCMPATHTWARLMNSCRKPIVLGYSPMSTSQGMVNLFARYETYMTGIQYLSYALAGIPYMGVGRNMLVDRKLKANNASMIQGQHLASGDDDLTINAIATSDNTDISIHPESFVYTDSLSTLAGFIRQKTRHISTSVYYKPLHQFLLSAFSGSQVLFYLILIIGLYSGTISSFMAIITYAIKQLVQLYIHIPLTKKLGERIGIHQLLLLDLQLFLYYMLMPFIFLIFKNDNRWS